MTALACDTTRRVPWPSELGFTRLTMLLRVAYADTPCDEDEEPSALAPQGTVTLIWNAPWFRYRPSDGGPVQGWGAQSVECQILPDGTIAPPESEAVSDGSVIVMPTVHELLEPSGSTITANIRLTSPGPRFAPISFQARPGATVNILAEADMGKQPGVIVEPVVTETTAERAEAAALRAETAATSAETAASSVEAGLGDLSGRVEWIEQNGDTLFELINLHEPGDSYDIPSGWTVATLRAGSDGAVLNTVYGERVLGPNQWALKAEWANELPLTGTLTLVSGSISYGTATYQDRIYTPYSHLSDYNPHPEYVMTDDLPEIVTTAERAEAAAERAETAAAEVADIGEQVEQVQTYTTRAETAATNAETAASSAEAASAEAATVTTDAAYIRDVIAQHGTLKGDPGRDGGPVPVGGSAGQVITRTADGGVAWTDMQGGDGLNIVGPGRPDQPGTTGLLIDGSETVGTTYTSTDGAGVGAWVWRKRPTGWTVVDGDTGVREVTADVLGAEGICTIQRIGSTVTFTTGKLATNYNQVIYTVPAGFWRSELIRGGQLVGATLISSQATTTMYAVTHPLLLSGKDQIRFHGQNLGTGQIGSASIAWRSYHPWPTTLPGASLD